MDAIARWSRPAIYCRSTMRVSWLELPFPRCWMPKRLKAFSSCAIRCRKRAQRLIVSVARLLNSERVFAHESESGLTWWKVKNKKKSIKRWKTFIFTQALRSHKVMNEEVSSMMMLIQKVKSHRTQLELMVHVAWPKLLALRCTWSEADAFSH